MLISKCAKVKWNAKITKHYKELGYKFTKMGDEFEVKVEHLTKGSNSKIKLKCDYCGKEYEIKYCEYYKRHNKNEINKKDSCDNIDCYEKKAKESIIIKYGTDNFRKIESINEKIKQTNLEKFGCENPFGNEEIKNKIKHTMLNKYGVEYYAQTDEQKEKSKKTQLERYGVENYGAWLSTQRVGEKNPRWKGGLDHHRIETATYEYRTWRKAVFDRDLYTCQCCGKRHITLNSHHIKNWKDNPNDRYDVNNGITLCEQCHKNFHSKYGKRNNNEIQLKEFLETYNNNR